MLDGACASAFYPKQKTLIPGTPGGQYSPEYSANIPASIFIYIASEPQGPRPQERGLVTSSERRGKSRVAMEGFLGEFSRTQCQHPTFSRLLEKALSA